MSEQSAGKRGQKARGGMATTFGSTGRRAPLNLRLVSLHLHVSPSQGCILQSLPDQQKQRGAFAQLLLCRLEQKQGLLVPLPVHNSCRLIISSTSLRRQPRPCFRQGLQFNLKQRRRGHAGAVMSLSPSSSTARPKHPAVNTHRAALAEKSCPIITARTKPH